MASIFSGAIFYAPALVAECCPEFENTGRDPRFTVGQAVWVNLTPQTYEVRLSYESGLPEGCMDEGEAEIDCEGPRGMHWFGRCEATETTQLDFELEAGAQTLVDVPLP